MPRSQSKLQTPVAVPPQLDEVGEAQLLALHEQAELLGLLIGSVRTGHGPFSGKTPAGVVDLVGALGPLESAGTPGSDPLAAFATVVPRFAADADEVVRTLGVA